MSEKKLTWHKVADTIDAIQFASNNIAVVELDGKKICLARSPKAEGILVAFAYKCPHAGGILADGFIDALGNIVCPLHRYKFDPRNGRNITGEGYYLKHWPVEMREEGVYVGVEEGGGFWNLFK